jgi:hypothetical protein
MTPEQRKLAMDLVILPNGRRMISPEQFATRFPSAVERGQLALLLLEEAAKAQSADDLQATLIVGATFGFSTEHVPLLCDLLPGDWHFSHEDIVSTLQRLRDPRAVESLFSTVSISHSYLDYDEGFGLARKCTWALADIGTAEAKSRLEKIASSENPLIAGYAQKRLDSWEDESPRKKA